MPELIAGSVDLPLSREGEHEARDVGTAMALRGGLDQIISSPMKRAQQMAHIVAILNGNLSVTIDQGLAPWFLGFVEGQDDNNPLIKKAVSTLMLKSTSLVPRGTHPASTQTGESFATYSARLAGFMMKLVKDWRKNPNKLAIVTHSRTVQLIRAWAKTGLDNPTIDSAICAEGSGTELPPVMRLTVDSSNNGAVRRLNLNDSAELVPAIYLIRHAPTAWDSAEQVKTHDAYPHAARRLLAGLAGIKQ
jgi:broad specificity phosphatase PhoE